MSNSDALNPPVPVFLRIVTWVECVVVFSTAAVLFFLPALGATLWAWGPPPFNARFVGAIYFAALFPLVVFAVSGRWAPGRVVLWMIFTFTLSIAIASLAHVAQFEWSRWATYAFWFLYLFLPVNSVVHLYLLRDLKAGDARPTPSLWSSVFLAITVLVGLYGVALLIIPETVTAFWPWPIDAFHGRIYAATFLTPAVGAWIMRQNSSPSEYVTLGLTLLILGVLSIVGVVWTSATVPIERQVNYASLGTWLFFIMNLVFASVGGAIWMAGQRKAS